MLLKACRSLGIKCNMRCRKVRIISTQSYSNVSQSRGLRPLSRTLSNATALREEQNEQNDKQNDRKNGGEKDEQLPNKPKGKDNVKQGAMSRRLEQMTEQSLEEGSKSDLENIQKAGFSEGLKAKLEEKIAAASFKSDHAAAFSIANMPASAGKQTQDIAAASPWTGHETVHDSSLRMLNDTSKPMRVPFKPPNPAPAPVNLKPNAKRVQSSGQRLASARERTSDYELSREATLSQQERETIRNELREGFALGARTFPGTLKGLSSLANERIEDAIKQGEFRNLPRGKGKHTESEQAAASPHLDTTEYLMNRIMQKQHITPEWIQKQQELRTEVERFRGRLRADWRRHASRLIASQGGSLQTQIRRAQAYAAAESDRIAAANERAFAASNDGDDKALDKAASDEYVTPVDHEGRIKREPSTSPSTSTSASRTTYQLAAQNDEDLSTPETTLPSVSVLRDPQYLATEHEYHTLTIKKLNDLVRSYNLQAPPVSQRGYLSLDRELDRCYAEVAPSLPEEVRRRATERARDSNIPGREEGDNSGLQQVLGMNQTARVHDEDSSKGYGFKELWRDLWQRKEY